MFKEDIRIQNRFNKTQTTQQYFFLCFVKSFREREKKNEKHVLNTYGFVPAQQKYSFTYKIKIHLKRGFIISLICSWSCFIFVLGSSHSNFGSSEVVEASSLYRVKYNLFSKSLHESIVNLRIYDRIRVD